MQFNMLKQNFIFVVVIHVMLFKYFAYWFYDYYLDRFEFEWSIWFYFLPIHRIGSKRPITLYPQEGWWGEFQMDKWHPSTRNEIKETLLFDIKILFVSGGSWDSNMV